MFSSSSRPSKEPLLFDIRLRSLDNDVLLIKGPPDEASSVLLSGTIVLSITEPIQIKSLALRLFGRLRLNIPTVLQTVHGPYKRYSKFERNLYSHFWDDFNIKSYFQNLYDNHNNGKITISSKSSTNLAALPKRKRALSTASLVSSNGQTSTNKNYHTLVKGNYEFPFSAIIPGSLVESVEGLPNAAVTYTLEATIERPKQPDLISKKHLRVIRTLAIDAVELSETVSVDNSWPEKVDYTISIPTKAIAIGSSAMINILIVPVLKGLKLGPVRVSLVETSQYCGSYGGVINQDRIVTKLKLKDPLKHVAQMKKKRSMNEASDDGVDSGIGEFQDKWEVQTLLKIPPSLTKCSQDCRILSNIKVRHKIKFTISLLNPDGHISELRAALPVQLFISPFVPVNVKTSDVIERTLRTFGPSYQVTNQNDSSFSNRSFVDDTEEDVIFQRSISALQLSSMPTIVSGSTLNVNAVDADTSITTDATMVTSLMIPPNYGNHVYDRVYGEVANQSEISTSAPSTNIEAQLIDDIQNLHISDSNNANDTVLAPNPQIRIDGDSLNSCNFRGNNVTSSSLNLVNNYLTVSDSGNSSSPSGNRFNGNINVGLNSPSLTPSFAHLSRRNSYSRQTSSTSLKNDLELTNLSRVPSYDKAIKFDMIGEDLPPAYPEEEVDSQENKKFELERPQILHHKSTSSLLPYPGSRKSSNNVKSSSSRTRLSNSPLPKSNNSSSVSLQQLTRSNTDSSFNLNLSFLPTKGNAGSRHFPFNMTPSSALNSNNKNHSYFDKTESTSDVTKSKPEANHMNSSGNRRSRSSSVKSNNSNSPSRQGTGSFANLMEMFTRRDRA
ncbi:Rod1p [Saccharomyces cerevisiae x Saccharomyces kudriavzevii VIN7]|uniref:Rod1p n=1 Tax=Saccharomyces cerevisiae x Saccharomyces kudriavzevii (strain VIN7) TaxID=1095631 RepID=H0H101_SACCK|nr:Rod1p [Saccharomyces cerevisiae x Saccharomyces kudriavzevii VIN7]